MFLVVELSDKVQFPRKKKKQKSIMWNYKFGHAKWLLLWKPNTETVIKHAFDESKMNLVFTTL